MESELKKRIIGAIYFGLPFILFLYLGGIYLKIFLVFLSFIIFYEVSSFSNLEEKYFYFPFLFIPYFLDLSLSIFIFLIISFIIFLFKKNEIETILNKTLFPFTF
ncbi:MAG: hypothetical protein H5U37_07960, partial [Caldisericia bacterium]|nr:hypothetical protein [Caldisericia bacterium]